MACMTLCWKCSILLSLHHRIWSFELTTVLSPSWSAGLNWSMLWCLYWVYIYIYLYQIILGRPMPCACTFMMNAGLHGKLAQQNSNYSTDWPGWWVIGSRKTATTNHAENVMIFLLHDISSNYAEHPHWCLLEMDLENDPMLHCNVFQSKTAAQSKQTCTSSSMWPSNRSCINSIEAAV